MRKLTFFLLMLFSLTLSAKSGPTDQQLKDFCRNAGFALRGSDAEKLNAFDNKATEAEKLFDKTKIKPEQVIMLFDEGGATMEKYLVRWLLPVLEARKTENAMMAYLYWKYLPTENPFSPSDDKIDALKGLLARQDIGKLLESQADAASDIISGTAIVKGDKWQAEGMLSDVERILSYSIPESACQHAVELFNTAIQSNIDSLDKQTIRKQALAIYQRQYGNTTYTSRKKRLQKQIDYLSSPFACGTLIGNKAPQLHFQWISDGNELSLDDFIGKVVVLDFWATKCVPCVASFPEMAELQAHYAGRDVVIIGVTSPQGYFVDKPHNTTVNCAGHPEKEYELTPDYMKAMGMTWRVAYSKEDVMNPDYGALSIPHLTIIDRNGVVRYNNVTGDNETKIKLIDTLLN